MSSVVVSPWIVTGHHVQHDRGVFDRLTHGARVIERPRERNDAANADPTVSGFESDDAAVRSGDPDRPCRIGSDGGETHVGGDGRAWSSGRPAGSERRVPRIVDRAEIGDRRCAAVGEFMQVQLAQQDRTGVLESAADFRVFGWERDL